MCLAIYKPAGVRIKHERLKNGWDSNSHGAGFCYPAEDKSEVIIKKGFFTYEAFLDAYKQVPTEQMLIHFRWATHGARDAFNCHPWPITGPDGKVWYGVIHNGVISKVGANRDVSDTGQFVNRFLAPLLLHSRIDKPEVWTALSELFEEFIGYGNKVAILCKDGTHVILNEDAGTWDHKCWWSNSCYNTVRVRDNVSIGYQGSSQYNPSASRSEFTASDIVITKDTIHFHIKSAVGEELAQKITARAIEWMECGTPTDLAYIYGITEVAPEDFGVPDSEKKNVPTFPSKAGAENKTETKTESTK